ncbi:MAG TPA: hypothetical protein VFQ84_10950 [Arenimonas sp.]|uniref:hypothetical protein n=1 Tax=Arenimonas sp. TaxID=1872635 RepID=UPI002D7F1B58|nr:hypothetical protein [Arenimonas sp.]HEU0153846.1 hypothetical protein [Arenimonas sp.]
MKFGLALLLAGLVGAVATLAPAPARAGESHDCTDGCYIITCNERVCATWRCDERGCQLLNTFQRSLVELQAAGAPAKRAGPPEVAHARVCPANRPCELYELNTSEALHLGSFDNVDDLAAQRRALRALPRR